jgi:hypothetical protein
MPETSGLVETGGQGLHHYLTLDRSLPKAAPWEGIEVQATGGLVVAPPSRHFSGRVYRWIRPLPAELPTLPYWIRATVEADQAPALGPIRPSGTITGDDLVAAFRAAGAYVKAHPTPGWHRVRCLWADEHSSTKATGALLTEPGTSAAPGWGYVCMHAHCAGRSIGAVLDRFQIARRR